MAFLDFLPLIGDVVSGLFGNKATSSANSTNLQLNRENNAANRANMERQNQMNIEQWNRENAYNHPAAQMGRFTAAGLNPNLIYGQSNTAPQLSGSLGSSTSQAGSVMPNDAMSKMFGKLGETLMRIPMYREQVRGLQLDNDAKEFENEFRAFIHTTKFDPLGLKKALSGNLTPAQRKYLQGLQNDINQGDSIVKDIEKKELQNALASETFQSEVDRLASEAKISKENADYLAKSAVYRLDAEKYQSELRELEMLYQKNKNEWMNWDRWISHGINAAGAVGDILALKNIFGMFSKKGILESGGKGHWKKIGENTYEWNGN